MKATVSRVIGALAISITVATARAGPHNTVCRGDVYSAESATNPYFKDATWIGKCFFKSSNIGAAKSILEECHYHRPCVVKATILDSGEIVQVHFVKLDGRDMTCRGMLKEVENTGGDNIKIGPCEFTIDQYTGAAITDRCRLGQVCTVQARVAENQRRLWITHVYSARPGR
jgi:hypothetical protein